jgi:hypothetical protein
MRAAAALCVALALACSAEETPPRPGAAEPVGTEAAKSAPAAAPPASLRATVVLEPPRIEIGDLFTVEVAVVTPPGHRVAPAPVPKAIPGLAIVDASRASVDHEPGRWVHHQRFRARASATGPLRWPALEIGVEAPDGTRLSVIAAERPFEVVSLLAENAERRSPFSFRRPRLDGPSRGPWLPALLGSLATLAVLALISGVRRIRRGASLVSGPAEDTPYDEAAAVAVLAALQRAEAEADDPVHAADLASEALRSWAAERFRAPRLRAATTEELAREAPPFLLSTRYAALLTVLEAFDALRFPPLREGKGFELRAALQHARELVADAGGPGPNHDPGSR